MTMKIYTDGSLTETCYVINGQFPVRAPTIERSMPPVTGNQAEYYALLRTLQAARRQGIREVEIFADSELMVKQLTRDAAGGFVYETKDERLQQLGYLVHALEKEFDRVTYTWIPREQNLAGLELDRKLKRRGKDGKPRN